MTFVDQQEALFSYCGFTHWKRCERTFLCCSAHCFQLTWGSKDKNIQSYEHFALIPTELLEETLQSIKQGKTLNIHANALGWIGSTVRQPVWMRGIQTNSGTPRRELNECSTVSSPSVSSKNKDARITVHTYQQSNMLFVLRYKVLERVNGGNSFEE